MTKKEFFKKYNVIVKKDLLYFTWKGSMGFLKKELKNKDVLDCRITNLFAALDYDLNNFKKDFLEIT